MPDNTIGWLLKVDLKLHHVCANVRRNGGIDELTFYDVRTKLRKSDKWKLTGRNHTKSEAKSTQHYWKKKGWYAQVRKK